jgi:hypothetical protein
MSRKFDPEVEQLVLRAAEAVKIGLVSSASQAAQIFGIHYQRVLRRINGHSSLSSNGGHNKALNETQELTVQKFLDRSIQLGFPLRHDMLWSAAQIILRRSDSTRVLSHCWPSNFVKLYSRYHNVVSTPLATIRKAAHKVEVIKEHFARYKRVVEEKGIDVANIYNFDETGFRIGCARGSLVITHATISRVYIPDPDNRETITSVECISAGGFAIQPMLIMSGKTHRHKAFDNDLNGGILVGLSDSGYSNEILGLEW